MYDIWYNIYIYPVYPIYPIYPIYIYIPNYMWVIFKGLSHGEYSILVHWASGILSLSPVAISCVALWCLHRRWWGGDSTFPGIGVPEGPSEKLFLRGLFGIGERIALPGHMGVSINEATPIAGWSISWKIHENPIKMDDNWGYPHDLGHLHMR